MASRHGDSTPLGVKIVAVWALVTGIALLVLGVARTLPYVPVGAGLLVGAYGLWNRDAWGLALVSLALVIEGVQDIVTGRFLELAIVLLVLAYLYRQRAHFPTAPFPLNGR